MKSIVFIEKEVFLENLLKLTLKEEGVSVYCPDEGVDFFYFIEDIQPEVVFLDIDSVEDEGEEFLKIWDEKKFSFKTVLILTGQNRPSLGKSIPFISKPISPSSIFLDIKKFQIK